MKYVFFFFGLIFTVGIQTPSTADLSRNELVKLRTSARTGVCPDIKWSKKWECSDKRTCSGRKPVNSCEEAYFRLLVCGEYKRDGGYKNEKEEPDGVPCEAQCEIVDDDQYIFNGVPLPFRSTANFCASE